MDRGPWGAQNLAGAPPLHLTCLHCFLPIVGCLQVWAPLPKYQLHGITRANTLRLCQEAGIPFRELDFSLTKVGGCGGPGRGTRQAGRRAGWCGSLHSLSNIEAELGIWKTAATTMAGLLGA